MIRKLGFWCGLWMAWATWCGAEQLLRNADFASMSPVGLPLHWVYRGDHASDCRTADGVLTLHGVLVQDDIRLTAGENYRLSAQVRSTDGAQYRFYAEWTQQAGGATLWLASDASWFRATPEWTDFSADFLYTPDSSVVHVAAVVSEGTVEFRNLKLVKNEPATGRRHLGGEWLLFGTSAFDDAGRIRVCGAPGAILRGVPLLAGRRYRAEYLVRADGSEDQLNDFRSFRVEVDFGGTHEPARSPWDDTWTSNFQRKSFCFTVPADSAGIVDIALTSRSVEAAGALWFDALSVAEAPEEEREKYTVVLDSPAYRNMIFASRPVAEIAGTVAVDDAVSGAVVTLRQGMVELARQEAAPRDGRIAFALPAAELAAGDYELNVALNGAQGAIADLTTAIRKLAPAPFEVVQGADRKFYRNGAVFFPIIYWEMAGGEPMAYAANHGFNLTITGRVMSEQAALEVLDGAAAGGVQVMLGVGFPEQIAQGQLELWQHQLYNVLTPEVMTHPALFGYFLADEPYWAGVPVKNLLAAYETLKSCDPYHPVWINAAPRGSVDDHRVYSQAADIYGADIYPVPYPNGHSDLSDKMMTAVGAYAERMGEATGGRKAIWMALQGFSWNSLGGSDDGSGYPTAAELRFMTFDALTRGAQAVSYWGMRFVKTPEFFDRLFAQAVELRALSGLWSLGEPAAAVHCDQPAIRVTAWQWEGNRYWVALNTGATAVSATVSGAGGDGVWTVFGEERTVTVRDGQWRDRWEPFAVHVYVDGELPPSVVPDPGLPVSEDPYRRELQWRAAAVRYQGRAQWIWDGALYQTAGSKIQLVRRFELTQPVQRARLLITADNQAQIAVNGQALGKVDNWSQLRSFDLTHLLRVGDNWIAVTATDAGSLPCGVLADLELESADGAQRHIVSDRAWLTTADLAADPAVTHQWQPAFEIADAGKGIWGADIIVVP